MNPIGDLIGVVIEFTSIDIMKELLTQVTTSLIKTVNVKVDNFINLSPYILGGIAIFLFGWILAILADKAIVGLGHKIKLEFLADKIGLKHFLDHHKMKITPSKVIAKSIKGYLIFVFFIEATKVAQLKQIAVFLDKVNSYIPEVIIALFIMLVAIRIGRTLQSLITTSLNFAKANTANVLGMAAKYTMVTFGVLAALSQLQIAEILINIMFIGFISFLTIAGGLAFGLGGKEVVQQLLEDIKRVEIKEIRKEIRDEIKHKK